ncbi:MAG TPA: hypothetical protein VFZ65_00175 [Planctomycetota bacterium]|nr:hypothetical protein [Planctomycetota bacterium]
MAGPRRRGPLPVPPPLGGIVVDGSNVIASSRARPIERLDLVSAWCRDWRPDLAVWVFLDHSTYARCPLPAQRTLRARCEDVTPGRARCVVCPRHESADVFVLQHARAHLALVVSNDRYFDHEELRRNAITVQFTLAGDRLEVHDEATWFRSPGAAQRVPMVDLQQRR